ncbi:MAG: AMP-binding protein [Acidimicrobiia bacterium]
MGFQLADCFARVASAVPSTLAVEDNRTQRTYAQLDRRANQAAHALTHLGVAADDTVAVALPNRIEHLEVLLGAWKLGAVPININTRYTADETAYVLESAGVRAAITDARLSKTVARAMPDLAQLVVDDESSSYEAALARSSATPVSARRSGSDRYVLFTGGTTGMPKGALWRHDDIFFGALGGRDITGRQLVHSLDDLARVALAHPGEERVALACPLFHGTAQWMALRTLFRGGTVLLDGSPPFDAHQTWKRVHASGATALVIPGDVIAQPLAQALHDGAVLPASLNVIYSGGARLTPAIARALVRELEHVLVADGYGATETGGLGIMVYLDGAPDPEGFRVSPEIALISDELVIVTTAGLDGEIAFRGRMPVGYLGVDHTPMRTTLINGTRWYLTGDIGCFSPDQLLLVRGRRTASMNSGGEKVYPDEVEAALMSHPTIADAIVYSVPDTRFGDRIEADVVLTRGVQLPADVDAFLRARIAGFKVPREIHVEESIPRTTTGKPDRLAAQRARNTRTA